MATKKSRWVYALIALVAVVLGLAAYRNSDLFRAFLIVKKYPVVRLAPYQIKTLENPCLAATGACLYLNRLSPSEEGPFSPGTQIQFSVTFYNMTDQQVRDANCPGGYPQGGTPYYMRLWDNSSTLMVGNTYDGNGQYPVITFSSYTLPDVVGTHAFKATCETDVARNILHLPASNTIDVSVTKCGNGVLDKACVSGGNAGQGCATNSDCTYGGTCSVVEVCDDGSQNGQYDKCNSTCTGPGPRCGDGSKNGPEQCDKADLGSKTCNAIVAGSIGTLACNNSTQGGTCTFNTSGCHVNPCSANACNAHGTCTDNNGAAVCACTGNWTGATCSSCKPGFSGPNCDPTPVCGDNVKNRPEEECDGTDLAGKTCATEVGQGSTGTLRCTTGASGCRVDETACSAAACEPATCFTDVEVSKVDDYLLGLYTPTASEMVKFDINCNGSVTDGDAGYIADHASATCP